MYDDDDDNNNYNRHLQTRNINIFCPCRLHTNYLRWCYNYPSTAVNLNSVEYIPCGFSPQLVGTIFKHFNVSAMIGRYTRIRVGTICECDRFAIYRFDCMKKSNQFYVKKKYALTNCYTTPTVYKQIAYSLPSNF